MRYQNVDVVDWNRLIDDSPVALDLDMREINEPRSILYKYWSIAFDLKTLVLLFP